MLLIRYSSTGFKPYFQSQMAQGIEYLKLFDEKKEYDDLSRIFSGNQLTQVFNTLKQGVLSSLGKLDSNFPLTGIHVFFSNVTKEEVEFHMNHVTDRPPMFRKHFPDTLLAYPLGRSYLKSKTTLRDLFDHGHTGAYLPLPNKDV
jgi:hypothetical protein